MSDEFPVPVAPAPSAPEPAAPAPVEPAPTPSESTAEPATDEPPKAPEERDPHELPKGVQRRIDRAVRQRYEAEARARVAEEQLANFRQSPQQPREADPAEPTIDKYSNIEHYVADKAKWVANQEIQRTLTENARMSRQEQENQSHAQAMQQWAVRLEAATAEMPDFEDVIASSTVPMSGAMERAIVESDVGPKLAYWLAQNPEEAFKISQLPPTRAFAQLGRIEERLITAKPATPKASTAPPPIKPVGTRASVSKDPDQMGTDEWMKWRRDQLAKK